MPDTTSGLPEDGGNDLGTAYVREAGCGVRYIINLEDTDEEQFEVELDREQAERLYAVLGKMLEKDKPISPPAPINPVYGPLPNQRFWWNSPPIT